MSAAAHSLGKLDLRATVCDIDLALALRPRLETLAWRLAPAVIERVCDAVLPPDMHLRVARLDLDLGTVRPDYLEEDALAALEQSLAEAIGEALHEARYAPSDQARLMAGPGADLERFERYLVSGTVQWHAGEGGFDPAAALRSLIADQPVALAAMLRRQGRARHVIERLVLQADPEALRALLAVLAPADAAIILALIADVMLAHRADPPPPLEEIAEPALERLLWITTFEFLLRDAGTQFNRRRFLGFLLGREAARLGIDYAALLRLLAGAVETVRARTGLRSSLPVVLTELIAELGPAAPVPPVAGEAGTDEIGGALAAARGGNFGALLALARRLADDRPRLEALIGALDEGLFAGLIGRIDQVGAETALAILDELGAVEREAGVPTSGIEPTLRWLTLRYLLHGAGSGFNSRRFAAHLIEHEAARAGIGYLVLLGTLQKSAGRVRGRSGATRPLSAILADLLDGAPVSLVQHQEDDLAAAVRARDPAMLDALIDRLDDAAFTALMQHVAGADAAAVLAELAALAALHRAMPVVARSDAAFARILRRLAMHWLIARAGRPFDRRALLRHLLRALAVETGATESSVRRAFARAAALPASVVPAGLADDLAALAKRDGQEPDGTLRRTARDPARLLTLAATLSAEERRGLLETFDARHAEAVAAQISAIERLHAVSALVSTDGTKFGELLWALAAAYLARAGGVRFDAAALTRALLEGIARYDGIASAELAARVEMGLRRGGSRPVSQAQASAYTLIAETANRMTADDRGPGHSERIELYLRTGRPPETGEMLPALAADDPAWLAAKACALVRATPANTPALLDRLLAWLLPEEVLACLMPGDPGGARRLAQRLDAAGAAAWHTALNLLLRGKRVVVPRQHEPASARFDRLAVVAHWLDHGAAPWWAGAEDPRLGDLVQASDLDLDWLFGALPAGEALARLRRAGDLLEPAAMQALLARLAPWAAGKEGPLQPMLAGLDARRRLDLCVRAAAASIEGDAIDLEALAESPAALPPPIRPATPPPDGDPSFEQLIAWLDGGPAGAPASAALAHYFARLTDARDKRLTRYLSSVRSRPAARARWVALLPDEALARAIHLIAPESARALLDTRRVLAAAWRRVAPFGASRPGRGEWWTLLLDLAAAPAVDPLGAAHEMIARLTAGHSDHVAALRAEAIRLAGESGHATVAAALRREPASKEDQPKPVPKRPPEPVTAKKQPADALEETPEPDHAIYIGNAGLVLLAPYFPVLFERLGLLTPDDKCTPRIAGLEHMSRAVHLLQYLADARLDRPEPLLTLNKLLCGLPTAQPILPRIDSVESDLAICDDLLDAVIGNWPIIANTSREALRETFLQREGRLRHREDNWDLQVQRKGLDVLVDQIPWTFSIVYHRWMPQPIKVTW